MKKLSQSVLSPPTLALLPGHVVVAPGVPVLAEEDLVFLTTEEVPQSTLSGSVPHLRNFAAILSANSPTLQEWASEWILRYPDVTTPEGRNRRAYEQFLRDYINPELGSVLLRDLSVKHVQRFVNSLNGKVSTRTRKPLSQTTRSHIYSCLKKCLNDAIAEEELTRNPCAKIRVPLPRNSNIEPPYNEDELKVLLAAKDIPYYSLIATLATTSLRPGEALALRWKNIDFGTSTLTVESALESRTRLFKEPKTHQKRGVKLFRFTAEVLAAHYKSSQHMNPDDLVFCRPDGRPLNESVVSHRFRASLTGLGLRKIRLYDLRHTSITLLLKAGVRVKVVQKRVGHSSATMTMDRYDHLLSGEQEEAIEALDSALFPKPLVERSSRSRGATF